MSSDPYLPERLRMVEMQIAARGINNFRILQAMRKIPRHLFVPEPYRKAAYEDRPLPIGEGQTISQPYIVAFMTELLDPQPEDHILEIGAGSGYQAAIIGLLSSRVTTVERLPNIAELARSNLKKAGIANVEVVVGDGTLGWPDHAPYHGIIVTAAAPDIPSPLIDQLADGGRMVAPLGGRGLQELVKIVKRGAYLERTYHGGVMFVPLIGRYGWREEML
ncbi:MAG: protein-L-isoaspartate(D-aspartate) O-methyltransferase [Methanomicrobiales archaeon]|nr:protein-L-isoaspartate(D-aspartate) O-methyltransferase [Methanomicrobiales archaeon]